VRGAVATVGEARQWHGVCFSLRNGGTTRLHNYDQMNEVARVDMRIYDIEFDIDSFLDEMEEMQRARRQRQQQIHRSTDAVGSLSDGPRDRDTD
jgi:hypothetical protein